MIAGSVQMLRNSGDQALIIREPVTHDDHALGGDFIFTDILAMVASLEKHSNDLLTGMQEYSGSGSKAYGGRVHSTMFGKEYRDIDFHKDKDQGHRALAFANIFKDNPEFNKLIKEMTSGASGLQTALQL